MTARSLWWAGGGVLAVACILVGISFFQRQGGEEGANPVLIPPRSVQEIQQDWRTGVHATLQAYEQEKDATKARDALLRLTVPGEQRSIHLALVLAFEALIRGQVTGPKLLRDAVQAFNALP